MRATWRLTLLLLHLIQGLATVATLFPLVAPARRRQIKRHWSKRLLKVVGVRLHSEGSVWPNGALVVANHVSWLDIFVINAIGETHFVCKDDVRAWPVLGWLVANTETVFIARGNRTAAARTAQEIVSRLRANQHVTVFPEGTTTDGSMLLPFSAALFQAAVDSGREVQPVSLRYTDAHGRYSRAPAYDGDITMWQCLRAILRSPQLHARVSSHVPMSSHHGRRKLCHHAYRQVAVGLGFESDTVVHPGSDPTEAARQSQPLGAAH